MEIDKGSLDVPAGKVVVGARFEVTGVDNAPASISVQLSNGTTLNVALSEQVGTVAYYSTKIQAGLTVTNATAVVASNWSGQFQLLSYTFATGSGTSGGTSGGTASGGAGGTHTGSGSTSGSAGQGASGNTGSGTALSAGQAGSVGSVAGVGSGGGFPAGATGEAANLDHGTPSWALIGMGIAGLLGAVALTVRSAYGKRVS